MELPLTAQRRAFIEQSARYFGLPADTLGGLEAVRSPITAASAEPARQHPGGRRMSSQADVIDQAIAREYTQGFVTDIESDTLPPGLDESVIRAISARKQEPDWMLQERLKAYRHWREMPTPG